MRNRKNIEKKKNRVCSLMQKNYRVMDRISMDIIRRYQR